MQAVLATVRAKLPRAHILALGLYPRGRTVDGWRTGRQPGEFSGRIDYVNAKLAAAAAADPRLTFLDCSRVFLARDGHIMHDLMPDYLHPSEHGAAALASCLAPAVHKLVAAADAAQQ